VDRTLEAAEAGRKMDNEIKSVRVRSFRDLMVWQKAMDLTLTIYRLTHGFPPNETYGLTSQLRRCSVSIPSDIAEGQGRSNTRELAQFLGIARGSNCELQTQLEIARRLGFGDSKLLDQADNLAHEVGKMIFTMLGTLRTKAG